MFRNRFENALKVLDRYLDRLQSHLLFRFGTDHRSNIIRALQHGSRLRSSRLKSQHIDAMLHVYEGNPGRAIGIWTELLQKTLYDPAITNLGYLLFHRVGSDLCRFARSRMTFSRMVQNGTRRSTMLFLGLLLKVGERGAENAVQKHYIEHHVKPRVRRVDRTSTPIFFWHIPKCAGTSLKTALGRYFYGEHFRNIIPTYHCFPLLKYCVEDQFQHFPFLHSSHMDVSTLRVPDFAV